MQFVFGRGWTLRPIHSYFKLRHGRASGLHDKTEWWSGYSLGLLNSGVDTIYKIWLYFCTGSISILAYSNIKTIFLQLFFRRYSSWNFFENSRCGDKNLVSVSLKQKGNRVEWLLYPNRYLAPVAVIFLPILPFGLVSWRVNMNLSIDVNGTHSIY